VGGLKHLFQRFKRWQDIGGNAKKEADLNMDSRMEDSGEKGAKRHCNGEVN
jgi:hypothetical protein